MSTYIEYNVLCKLNNDFLKDIKIISVFGHEVSEVLVVTKDDKVFGFGQNDNGVLGFGHNRRVKVPKIIEELCGKGIISFVNGYSHVFGLTNDGRIYSWGQNNYSQLGNGIINDEFNKPKINEYLINESIMDISCGAYHSLVLTEKSELFVWGYNNFGQIGNKSEDLFQLTPFKLNEFNSEKIIGISCGYWHSLALTENGNVFSWGSNIWGQLGIVENYRTYFMLSKRILKTNKPKLVIVIENKYFNFLTKKEFFKKICCGYDHSMLLSRDGDIYTFGCNGFGQIGNNSETAQMTPQKINSSVKYIDIGSHFLYNISIALSADNLYYIWGKFGEKVVKIPNMTQIKTIDNIFLSFNQITYKSLRISLDFEKLINTCLDNEENEISGNTYQDVMETKDHLNDLSLLFSSNILAKYRKPTKIKYENIIISFHFIDYYTKSHYISERNYIYVTEDSKVYAQGSNSNGIIGIGHKSVIYEKMIINELCYKGIIDLTNGLKHVIARTNDNHIYIWGYNDVGQLGNETNDDCFVPQLVHKLSNKSIFDISTGYWHSLALTENGEVYAWGGNEFGQIGNQSYNNQLTPIKIKAFDEQKIIAISCGVFHSLALTVNGRVYSWGHNHCGQLGFSEIVGLNVPKFIKIRNKKKEILPLNQISCGKNHSLLLSSDGDIYGFGSNKFGQLGNQNFFDHFIPTKIMVENKFKEIASHKDFGISVALSINGVYYIWGECGQQIITDPRAIQFDSFNSIFLSYHEITYKKIRTNIKCKNKYLIPIKKNGEYLRKFVEYGIIGFGAFGIVSKAKKNKKNKFFAIKRIGIKDKFDLSLKREIKIMSNLKSDYIVELKSAWIEDNYLLINGFEKFENSNIKKDHMIFKPENLYLLHIRMKLCFKSLKEIIKQINNELNQKTFEILTQIRYYIASELLVEIIECVAYLHKQEPPIIHRDLKPSNFLIVIGINGRFVKLADFGLAKFHEMEEQSHTKGIGTFRYMAPEILRSEKYDTKADVFSLGKIIPELFNFDFNALPFMNINPLLENEYKYLKDIIFGMTNNKKTQRLNCEQVLKCKNDWSLSLNHLKDDSKFIEICNQSLDNESHKTNFCSVFVQSRLRRHYNYIEAPDKSTIKSLIEKFDPKK